MTFLGLLRLWIRGAKVVGELIELYNSIRSDIESRLSHFRRIWETKDDFEIFKEFIFCLLTPQSRAKVCWNAILKMELKGVLLNGRVEEISEELRGVRFKRKKALYVVEAREKFFPLKREFTLVKKIEESNGNIASLREFIVNEVKGMGYKEASHFLRNIGFGDKIAILDRHILRNLKRFGVIDDIPSSLSKRRYLEIEKKMLNFSKRINIPNSHLDLLLWFRETGEIFK